MITDQFNGKTIKKTRLAECFLGGEGRHYEKNGVEHFDAGIIIEFTDGTIFEIAGPNDEGVVIGQLSK